uniref:Recombinase family protein n=1 Tax=Bosea sp. NBC_00436 TaxID=2969620 RepID=A0A9E8CMZ5_9HYPH
MTRAYSYIRMSSGRQLKGDSLTRQLELSESFATLHGLDLDTSLRDLGVSAFDGSNREKGALAAFLKKVRAGEIERGSYLLIESLDRLSRDHVMKALRVFQDILEAGVVIATVADGYIYSEESINRDWTQLIVSLAVMSRAHEESARKADRLRGAWTRKRQQRDKKLTARTPSWLQLADDRVTFIVDEERARIAVRMLEELAGGIGRDKIARRLNADGIVPWGGGREWHGGTVQKVTDSEALIGRFQPRRIGTAIVDGVKRQRRIPVGEPIEDYFPRIVSEDLWMRARRASDSRARSGPGNAGGRRGTVFSNLLSGLPRCASCGSPMNYRDRGPRSVPCLRCSGERNGTCENDAKIRYPDLEAAVIRWARFHQPPAPPKDDPAAEALAAAERRRAVLAAMIERLTDAIERGEPVEGRLSQRRAELLDAEREVAQASRSVSLSKHTSTPEARRGAVTAVLEADGLPPERRFAVRAEANQVLRELITEIRCHPDGRADLHFDDYGKYLKKLGNPPKIERWPVMPAVL